MIHPKFAHIETWVFDLDHTLYPPNNRLFEQIETRMTAYIMRLLNVNEATASRMRSQYWRDHGTTLAGLMQHHGTDPMPFLHDVHNIDFTVLSPDPDLAAAIRALPGRKIIYTNGSADYAQNVLAARGLLDIFGAVYGVEHAGFRSKPDPAAFDAVFQTEGLTPHCAAMFEDDPRNLVVPHALGLTCVLVGPPQPLPHIHAQTQELTSFLKELI